MTEPTPKTPGANAESAPLNLRAPHDVLTRLARVASMLPPGLFSKHRLAVLALEHGLAVIERDPMILLRGPAESPAVAAPPPESPAKPTIAPVVAPAPPAPVRPSLSAPSPATPPAPDPRQLELGNAARGTHDDAHARLNDRYTGSRERFGFTHDDATRALAAAGVPVENLRRELVKPTAQWTSAHAAALGVWLDTIDATGWAAPSEPSPAKAPTRTRARAVATPENEAMRVRYRAALAAKRLTGEATAKRIGCSEGTLRQWKDGALQNLGSDKDPDGKWLAALTSILDALDAGTSGASDE